MSIESDIFKKFTPNFNKIIKYGFLKSNNKYVYETLFMNNEFKAGIEISCTGEVSGTVYDLENNDEFLPLRYSSPENQQGAFIGEVREMYKQILIDIRKHCFSQNYFIFPQTNRITNAIISLYGDYPIFMWKQFPNCGVFKNIDNNKWYGIIMDINYSKLGNNNKNPVEIINLKLDKEEIQQLLQKKGFYPAWHMNKKSWITITLDETLPDETILKLVEESYSYTVEHKKRLL